MIFVIAMMGRIYRCVNDWVDFPIIPGSRGNPYTPEAKVRDLLTAALDSRESGNDGCDAPMFANPFTHR